jgi:omega-6 fatty acid desaturase (delta-12 desaturase)
MSLEAHTHVIPNHQALAAWEIPQTNRSAIYLLSTLIPLILSLIGYAHINHGNEIFKLLFVIVSGCFFWRLFVIFHDLVHGNYFKNVFINNTLGWITGVILFTPFRFWKKDHLLHHATTGNLDRRGYGEIKTLTVEEFQTLSKYQKLQYQIYRNPVFLFVVAPLLLFLFRHRVAWRNWNTEKMSIHSTNLGIVFVAATIILLWGWQAYVFGYLTSLYLGFCIVAWFFYVQHHFENTYYSTAKSWSYVQGALQAHYFHRFFLKEKKLHHHILTA